MEHFENNPPGTFDAILMDVMMPVMDGIAATKAIRAMDRADAKTILIIAMTANAFEEDAKKMSASWHDLHTLAKPFQIEDVEKTIVECCK
ncbi:MAG: response regulator [Blautia wexlerae]